MLCDGWREAWGAVVFTVNVACTGLLPTVTVVDEQAGAGVALVAIVQLRVTLPVKPPDGVTVTAKFAELPALTVAEEGFGDDSEKSGFAGAEVTFSVTAVEWASCPDVPVTAIE
jgi:hypothetical protein